LEPGGFGKIILKVLWVVRQFWGSHFCVLLHFYDLNFQTLSPSLPSVYLWLRTTLLDCTYIPGFCLERLIFVPNPQKSATESTNTILFQKGWESKTKAGSGMVIMIDTNIWPPKIDWHMVGENTRTSVNLSI
jgi:hypothetical protein